MNIYVGNLPFSSTEEQLKALFAPFGTVVSARIIKDKFTGDHRGFGFVEMSDSEAQAAIQGLNGKDFDGKTLRINEARPKEEGAPRRTGGGNFNRRPQGSGYGNSGRDGGYNRNNRY